MRDYIKYTTAPLWTVFFFLVLIALGTSREAKAYKPMTRTPVVDIIGGDGDGATPGLPTGQVLSAGASLTSTVVIKTGLAESYGFDWEVVAAASVANLDVEVLQSNSVSGPFIIWDSTPLSGYTNTNAVTVTAKNDGTDIDLSPSMYAKLKFTNRDSADVTITRFSFFNQ